MINVEQLIAAGYRRYVTDNEVANNEAYSKWIVRGDDKLFALELTFYYFAQHFPDRGLRIGGDRVQPLGTRASAKAHLYIESENTLVSTSGFTLEMSLEPTATIEELEGFYRNAYDRLGCVPDLHNR